MVVWQIEVFPYFTPWSVVENVVEVSLESIHQTVFCLTNILYATAFACQALYNVGAFAGDVVFCHIFPAGGSAFYPS